MFIKSSRVLFVAVVLTTASCINKSVLPPEELPSSVRLTAFDTGLSKSPVSVGDIFVYDNPVERRQVVATGDNFIAYQDGQGGFSKTTFSAILPRLRWGSTLSAGSTALAKISGTLHPLAIGNRIVFREKTIRARPGTSNQSTWDCEVQEKLEIVVAAGSSETWQILCKINGRERALFNYADNIGGLVRMIYTLDDGSSLVRQLTGYAGNSQMNTPVPVSGQEQ
jgi:hypothetical protein